MFNELGILVVGGGQGKMGRDGLIGQLLDNRYQVIKKLGETETVYRVYDLKLKIYRALKVIKTENAQDSTFQQQLQHESSLKHPALVEIFTLNFDSSPAYLVMELIPGPTLEQRLSDLKNVGQWLPMSEAVTIVQRISQAVAILHQGQVRQHEIKPVHIMFKTRPGLPDQPVLIGLGFNQESAPAQPGSSSEITYKSPEGRRDSNLADAHSDIFSLGALLYYLTTQALPFEKEPLRSPRELQPQIPAALEKVILKALEREPERNYASATALAEDLTQVLGPETASGLQIEANFANGEPVLRPGKSSKIPSNITGNRPVEDRTVPENRKNPYVAGSPIRGEEMFFGRDEVFNWLCTHLIGKFQDNAIVLYGERRTGKTSVLYHVPRRLGDPAYIPIFIDLQQLSLDSLSSFFWQVATKISSGLHQIEGVGNVDRPTRQDFTNAPGVYFGEIFLTQVQAAIGQRKLLVMFDEFSRMRMKVDSGDLPPDIFDYLRALLADHRLSFIITLGSKLEEMETQYSTLFNQAIYHKITFLAEIEARALITQPVASYYAYKPTAVDLILKATSGHPFYIQHICHAIFTQREVGETQSVTGTAVIEVLPDVVEATAQNLKFTWDDIGPVEKAILAAMAPYIDQVGGSVSRDRIVEVLQANHMCPPEGELTAALQTLRTRDVLREAKLNQYSFAVELLRLWVSKERRLDFVRHELATAGIIEAWQDTPPLPARSTQPWWRRPMAILAVVVSLLIFGLGVWLFSRLISAEPQTAPATAIGREEPAVTSEAGATVEQVVKGKTPEGSVEATATTVARATATAAKATVEALPKAIMAAVGATRTAGARAEGNFEDDFSSNTNGWSEGKFSNDYGINENRVIDGEYQRSIEAKRQGVLSSQTIPDFKVKNFRLQVEATLVETSAPAGEAQVAFDFRGNAAGDYYVVIFNNNGNYQISLWKQKEELWTILQDWQFSDAIKLEPGVSNTFEIEAIDSSFTFYANGQKLGAVTGATLTEAGQIGLEIGLAKAGQKLTVNFDNLVVKAILNDNRVAQIRATATANAVVMATAHAATATARAEGNFEDDFSSNTNRWWEGKFSDDYAIYENRVIDGKYQLSIEAKRQGVLSSQTIPDFKVKNFRLQVEATLVETSAPAGEAQVAFDFRGNAAGDYYVVTFANNGYYRVDLWKQEEKVGIGLQDWQFSDAIKLEPGVSNTFEIEAIDSSFTFYANGQALGAVTGATLTEAGQIDLGIGLIKAGQKLTVNFHNLVVEGLP